MIPLYYLLNYGKYCYIVKETDDMRHIRFIDNTTTLGDVHKNELAPTCLALIRNGSTLKIVNKNK